MRHLRVVPIQRTPTLAHSVAAVVIIAAHIASLRWLVDSTTPVTRNQEEAVDPETLTAILLPPQRPPPGAMPLPQLHLTEVRFDDTAPTQMVFGDADWDLVPGVIGAVSTPRPVLSENNDTDLFARRAGLKPGEAMTVVLSVQVLAEGSVGQLSVISSSGNPAMDEEAMSYVLSLRWIPGSHNRHATDMQIAWPVTLVADGSPSP
jgi:TonB family protein